jgi:hypothetical protein
MFSARNVSYSDILVFVTTELSQMIEWNKASQFEAAQSYEMHSEMKIKLTEEIVTSQKKASVPMRGGWVGTLDNDNAC